MVVLKAIVADVVLEFGCAQILGIHTRAINATMSLSDVAPLHAILRGISLSRLSVAERRLADSESHCRCLLRVILAAVPSSVLHLHRLRSGLLSHSLAYPLLTPFVFSSIPTITSTG